MSVRVKYRVEVPRIAAPSIAEHRELRRAALVEAARAILLESGVSGLGFATVAARAGMARNSVYDYFGSRDELVLAVCEDEFAQWSSDLEAALGGQRDPRVQVRRYVDVQLDFVVDGRHRLATLLAGVQLDAPAARRMGELHHQLVAPLHDALAAARVRDPDVRAALIQGVVNAATAQIEAGRSPTTVRRLVHAALDRGLV